MKRYEYPDLDNPAARWSTIADRHPRPDVGELVRLVGHGISGVVISDFPLVVRDGRGIEHETTVFGVRRVFA